MTLNSHPCLKIEHLAIAHFLHLSIKLHFVTIALQQFKFEIQFAKVKPKFQEIIFTPKVGCTSSISIDVKVLHLSQFFVSRSNYSKLTSFLCRTLIKSDSVDNTNPGQSIAQKPTFYLLMFVMAIALQCYSKVFGWGPQI